MMDRQTTDQARLFNKFQLEDWESEAHLLRRINGVVLAGLWACPGRA